MKNERMFKEYMTALSEIHGKALSALLNSLYWKAIESFSDEQCESAFKELIFSAKFFPKPADIIETIRGKREDQATRAWIKVVDTVRRVGNYQSVQFDDPVIHSIFKFWGGWNVTSEWKDIELKWKQKEFERLYTIMSRNNNHPKYLPGFHEVDNAARGYEVETEVVKIGFDASEEEVSQITAG